MALAGVLRTAILLIIGWCLYFGLTSAEDVSVDVVNAARCRIRCLSLFSQGSSVMSVSSCQQDIRCSDCSRPCDLEQSSDVCEESCVSGAAKTPQTGGQHRARDATVCQESCRFLQRVNSIRPGTCPPETQATGFAAVCMKVCDSDADCDGSNQVQDGDSSFLKCCSNGCGWTCQRPTHVYDGMPNAADVPSFLERTHDNSVELTWHSLSSNSSGPVIYLVGSRWSIGRHFNEANMSAWHVATQTTQSRSVISHLKTGHWYQFRVAAVNIYGSRGWSLPSLAFKLSKDPAKPDPPSNLTEGDTVVVDGKVAVTIHWSPPKQSDLPVSRYKIYWSKRLKIVSAQLQSLQEMRRMVSGDQREFQLTDLEPDTTYYVQVQAITHLGDLRLKSDKASTYIVTLPLSRTSNEGLSMATIAMVTDSVYPTPVSPLNVNVQRIYYQNGLLRANISWEFEEVDDEDELCDKVLIYWSPEMCASESGVDEPIAPVMSATTHDNHFVVYDLRFSCRYLVRLQPVSEYRVTGNMAYISLSTPYCWQADVVGEFRPDCPRNSARLPEEPPDLQYSLLVGSTDITAKLTWAAPHVPIADPPITGYQVVWGPVLPPSHHLLMDQVASDSRELPRDVRSIIISVDEDTSYVVYVRAVSRYGHGRIASLRFITPQLEPPTSPNPPYVDVGSPTRQNAIRPPVSAPTPQYIFIGYTPTKREPNHSAGRRPLQNDVAVVAATPSIASSAGHVTNTRCTVLSICLLLSSTGFCLFCVNVSQLRLGLVLCFLFLSFIDVSLICAN